MQLADSLENDSICGSLGGSEVVCEVGAQAVGEVSLMERISKEKQTIIIIPFHWAIYQD